MVLRFLGSARNSSCEGPKDVGGIHRRGRKGGRCFDAWHDVGAVEAGAPVVEFAVVWGNGESCLGNLSLVDSQTPEGEKFHVGIDVLFVKILIFIVGVYELFSSRSARKDEGKGERESTARIALQRKGAREKLPRALRLMMLVALSMEGGQVGDHEASIDVLDGGDDLLDGE